jgi:nitrogen fixation/metabolism regulation signal transduction histidine kinase
MAHEIKNPLTPILLSAQRLRNKFLEKLNGKDLEIVDKTTGVIIDQVKSIDAMVSAFADYANTPQIEQKLIDLNALINQTIALYDAQKNVSIEFDLSGDVPELLLDSNSISRVLINLVKNAVEADKGRHDLIVTIATQYLPDDRIVRLSIKDNGNGFDESVLESVFEPYVTTKEKGSGLGMATFVINNKNITNNHLHSPMLLR